MRFLEWGEGLIIRGLLEVMGLRGMGWGLKDGERHSLISIEY